MYSRAYINVASNNPVAPSVPFKIDGSNYHPNGTEYLDGEWKWYTITSDVPHEIEMPDPWTNPSNGVTYYFSTWDDAVEDNPRTVAIEAGSSQSFYAIYITTPGGQPPPPPEPPPPPPSGVWRPFADSSIWNTKIPSSVTYRSDSLAMLQASCFNPLGVRVGDVWMSAIYDVDSSTGEGVDWEYRNIWGVQVPVPLGVDWAPSADGHALILDWYTNKQYDFFQFNGYSASDFYVYDDFKNGMGYGIPKQPVGIGSSGIAMIGGQVRPEEIIAGEIPHMVALNVGNSHDYYHCYPPAGHTAGWEVYPSIPIGCRIQLNPDYDISGLSPVAQIFAKAMQEYGGMPRDQTGGAGWEIITEWDGSVQHRLGLSWWDLGMSTGLLSSIPLSEYRVLEYGQKDANGNWVSGDLYP